ncbi:CU044_5270 family protein [Micromonospora sp. NBC_00362]|uniref:CU044_5270 family protein n=1 Tax=Micromonospora sp. NBC_00362 TaxID=2975975 RepID=UPI0022522029|nr:CU044_5270 family protein [Micromonospora sp. NBC_00362]MCX5122015.1 CU044_5270 family protein [Micromonospora sp. NBC_00362]
MLLKAEDPARGVTVPPPRTPVVTLIAQAEATQDQVSRVRPARPTRRLVLTAAAAAVVATVGAGTVLTVDGQESSPTAAPGQVLVPVAYQITTQPPPAGDHLRALASRTGAAPYDTRSGWYTYVRTQHWGGAIQESEDGRYAMSYVEKLQKWTAADGSGHQRTEAGAAQYPDVESATYFVKAAPKVAEAHELPFPAEPDGLKPLPTNRRTLAQFLHTTQEPADVAKMVNTVYSRYPVSRASRAMILNVLADVPGFAWRGNVTDRAGRSGVAITSTDSERNLESLLIFDPKTGALLAHEMINTKQHPKLNFYEVFLDYNRTDTLN